MNPVGPATGGSGKRFSGKGIWAGGGNAWEDGGRRGGAHGGHGGWGVQGTGELLL